MDRLYDLSFDISAQMIRDLVTAVTTRNFDLIKPSETELQKVNERIQRTKELMIEQIRTELDEI